MKPRIAPKNRHNPYIKRMFPGNANQYPNLSVFLKQRATRMSERSKRLGIAGAILGSTFGLLGGLFGALAGSGVIYITPGAIPSVVIGANVLAWGSFGLYALYDKRKFGNQSKDPFAIEARTVTSKLLLSQSRKRLHRELDPAGGALLEESARQWNRIRSAFSSPFWSDANLPEHWERIKSQALTASDRAMDEIVVLLANAHQEDNSPGWQRVMEDIASNYLGANITAQSSGLPIGFEPARAIAERLRTVASEMERLSLEAAKEVSGPINSSGAALDLCLNEIRSVESAEVELRRQVGG